MDKNCPQCEKLIPFRPGQEFCACCGVSLGNTALEWEKGYHGGVAWLAWIVTLFFGCIMYLFFSDGGPMPREYVAAGFFIALSIAGAAIAAYATWKYFQRAAAIDAVLPQQE